MASTSLFGAPISTSSPLALFSRRDNHPVPRKGITDSPSKPIDTNKFHSNLYLGSQTQPVWTQPYLVWVNKDPASWGLSISHADPDQFAFGPDVPGTTSARFFLSPLGLKSISFGAAEFNSATSSISTNRYTPSSVDLHLHADASRYGPENKRITLHLVLGMGFITARYNDLVPVLDSGVLFRSLQKEVSPRTGVEKWKVTLEDGKVWLVFVCPATGRANLNLALQGNNRIVGNSSFSGFIQIAKLPNAASEAILNRTAGAFPTSSALHGSISSDRQKSIYQFTHSRYGQNNANALLMYALPHHVASFEKTSTASSVIPGMRLQSPTKGMMTAVVADKWRLVESNLPTGYASWLPNKGAGFTNGTVMDTVRRAAEKEVNMDVENLSNLESMYFSGKALAKYAQIALVISDVLQNRALARTALARLISAMGRFTQNRQQFKLVYDRVWRGIISDAMNVKNDPMADFGNGMFNDHHFHYGYFIYTAAVIGHLEQVLNGRTDWVNQNKEWVNSLVRDVANPNAQDTYFPVSRAFDWFHGNSWAKGIFESGDGKDQESTSEDVNYAYGQRLWATVIGDRAMEGRALTMLAIMRRSFNMYFYLSSNNSVQPERFKGNMVTGILFENKVDHATFFGLNEEFIHGIHMLPLLPISPYVRLPSFVREEWQRKIAGASNLARNVESGWKGVLYANMAIFDPKGSWDFFAQDGFNEAWLDDGASRTWYLTMAAGLASARAGRLEAAYMAREQEQTQVRSML